MRAAVLLASALAVVAAPALAAAEPIKVKVVEIAGDVAYLEPGEAAGIVVGSVVKIGNDKLKVIAVTRTGASVRLGKAHVDLGDKGVADAGDVEATAGARQLPPPHALDDFRGQWPATVLPADQQTPKVVPLGAGRAPGKLRMVSWAQLFAAGSKHTVDGSLELGTRLSYAPYRDKPLALDLDAAARVTAHGASGSRVPVRVAAAQLRWGRADDPRIAIGRLRWASSATGMLDGARLSTRLGDVELAAFGGLVPDAVDGVPEPSAARFGAELAWDHDAGSWPAHAAVTAQGSTWAGTLDERRLSASADVAHGGFVASAFGEAQQFAADNPWGASAIELTSAGADVGWRQRGTHASVGVSMMRPERSLRLDAALPPEWLCTRTPLPGVQDEACAGGDLDVVATGAAGTSGKAWSLDGGGSAGVHRGVTRDTDFSGFLLGSLRVLPAHGRLLLGGARGRAGAVDWASGEGGVAFAPVRHVDLRLRYRFEQLAYQASLDTFVTHQLLGDADWTISRAVDASVSLALAAGDDRTVAIALATLIWRPYP